MHIIKKKEAIVTCAHGFSLVEVLLAMAATLIVLAATVGIFKSTTDMGNTAIQVSDVTQDIQASLNLIRRDLQKIADIPSDGLQLHGNEWNANRWCVGNVCGSTPVNGATLLLAGVSGINRGLAANPIVFDPVMPGQVNNNDAISILCEGDFINNIDVTIVSSDLNTTRIEPTLAAGLQNRQRFASIRQGDFIFLNGSFFQHVTAVADNRSWIDLVYSDKTGLNTNMGFANGDQVMVRPLRRIAYYLEPDNNGKNWLMRQVNVRPAVRLIPGIIEFDLTYDGGEPSAGTHFVEQFIGNGAPQMNYSEFYASNPERVRNIRRVNINIKSDAGTTAPGNNSKAVESTQTAQIAVRRYGQSPFAPLADPEEDDDIIIE